VLFTRQITPDGFKLRCVRAADPVAASTAIQFPASIASAS
jgi:hypothetical protein